MTEHGEASHPPPNSEGGTAPELLSEFRRAWREGQPLAADDLLSQTPALWQDKSFVLDLAYEEFCQRKESGRPAEVSSFCARFAPFEKSLARLIDVHEFLAQHPAVLAKHHAGWPSVGDRFLGYELVEELGHGTFGRVYLARETALGDRDVVVKLSCGGLREANTLGRLQHAHIVPVLSVQQDSQGITLLCMPFLGRTTLLDVLDVVARDGRITPEGAAICEAIERNGDANSVAMQQIARKTYVDAVVDIVAQCAEALHYAHENDICHFDLKPTNVLLNSNGEAMLLDFNLASDKRQSEMLIGGTLPYMSPEQIEAIENTALEIRDKLGSHSDIFALGVILFQLLSGRHPFEAALQDSADAPMRGRLREAQQAGPPSLSKLNPDVEEGLARVVESCLNVDIAKRPSAKELAVDLRRHHGFQKRTLRWLRRNRFYAGAACVLGAIAIALAIANWVNQPPFAERQFAAALTAYESGEFENAIEYLDRGLEEEPGSVRFLLARARAYQRLETEETLNKAVIEYGKIARRVNDPRIDAARGYCYSRLGSHPIAIRLYNDALDAGFASAVVHNDLGFSLLRAGQLQDAKTHVQQALDIDPNLQAAHHNLAWIRFQESFQGKADLLQDVLPELQQALELGPKSAALYRDLARVYAIAAKSDPQLAEDAMDALNQAVELGLTREKLGKDGFLANLKAHPRFASILKRASQQPSGREPRLVDPLQSVDVRQLLTVSAQ